MVDAPELPFARTTGPYERDVLAVCYRMSGSVHDARDLLRQTWQRAEQEYADQVGPVRDWLRELAVEVSVAALEGRDGRSLPTTVRPASDAPEGDLDERHEVLWLEPIPDDVLGPAATGIPLSEVTALQQLPLTERARLVRTGSEEPAPPTLPPGDMRAVLDQWQRAFEEYDVDRIAGLLTEDAVWEMPPFAAWFRGRKAIERLIHAACPAEAPGDQVLVPISANGQPGFALYMRDPVTRAHQAFQIQVLTLTAAGVAHAFVFFDLSLFEVFGLPQLLSDLKESQPQQAYAGWARAEQRKG